MTQEKVCTSTVERPLLERAWRLRYEFLVMLPVNMFAGYCLFGVARNYFTAPDASLVALLAMIFFELFLLVTTRRLLAMYERENDARDAFRRSLSG